jgi:hypothetical protein
MEGEAMASPASRSVGELRRAAGAEIGRIVLVDGRARALVEVAPRIIAPARSTVRLTEAMVGREAVLLFERGDRSRPIVTGLLVAPEGDEPDAAAEIEIDGHRVAMTAAKEIVLRCGAASITLTRAGKVLIRGTYLLSRSSGANRIRGASVQLN